MKKINLAGLSVLLSMSAYSQDGGGWVGNSPVMMASNGTYLSGFESYSYRSSDSRRNNYFLNEKGEHSGYLALGYTLTITSPDPDLVSLGGDYSYGISNDVTFSAPLVFKIGLINNQSHGSELAMTIGTASFGYTSNSGMLILPTFGLNYTWGGETFRLIADISLNKWISLSRKLCDDCGSLFINSDLRAIYNVEEWISLNAGFESLYVSKTDYTNSIAAGPNFHVTKHLDFLLRAAVSQHANHDREKSALIGIKYTF